MVMTTMTEVARCALFLFHEISHKTTWAIAAVLLVLPIYSNAADWKITPILSSVETYTDNVMLAPRGSESGDFITQINPGISVTGTGARLKINANYTMQNLFYLNQNNQSTTMHQLDSKANATLVKNFLFLDSTANISQQNISLLGPLTNNNENITNNRTSIKTYSISPYVLHNFSNFATAQARYTHNAMYTDVGGLSAFQSDSMLFNLTSGSAFHKLGWGLTYNQQKMYGFGIPVESELASGNLRYRVSSTFSLTGTSGYQKFSYSSVTGVSAGSFWNSGFIWTPSERTNITANAGKAFFGNTYTLLASHRARRSTWSLSYNQNITSAFGQSMTPFGQSMTPGTTGIAPFPDQFGESNFSDTVMPQQTMNASMPNNGLSTYPFNPFNPINTLTNQFFLQKSLQATVALTGKRSTLVFSMFHMLMEPQTQGNSTSISLGTNFDTKQIGANALWSYKVAPLANANIGVMYFKSNIPALGQEDETKTFTAGLTQQILPKLNGAVNFRHIERTSIPNLYGAAYRENAITATLSMRF